MNKDKQDKGGVKSNYMPQLLDISCGHLVVLMEAWHTTSVQKINGERSKGLLKKYQFTNRHHRYSSHEPSSDYLLYSSYGLSKHIMSC